MKFFTKEHKLGDYIVRKKFACLPTSVQMISGPHKGDFVKVWFEEYYSLEEYKEVGIGFLEPPSEEWVSIFKCENSIELFRTRRHSFEELDKMHQLDAKLNQA
jgi:hypothetical protein